MRLKYEAKNDRRDRRRLDAACDEHQPGRPHAIYPGGAENLYAQERRRHH